MYWYRNASLCMSHSQDTMMKEVEMEKARYYVTYINTQRSHIYNLAVSL